jgi:hypothetical protein
MVTMTVRVAQGLVIASLILLLIYGADEGVRQGKEGGFLGIDATTRGIAFGGSAVALSAAAFFAARERSTLVSILLLVNGGLIILGGAMAVKPSIDAGTSPAGAFAVVAMGIGILVLGIIKSVRARAVKTA